MKNTLKRMFTLSLGLVSLSYAAHDGSMMKKDAVMIMDSKIW